MRIHSECFEQFKKFVNVKLGDTLEEGVHYRITATNAVVILSEYEGQLGLVFDFYEDAWLASAHNTLVKRRGK